MDPKTIESIWKAFQEVQEGKKKAPVTDKDDDGEGMDPVGQEDGDIDNDGDKDSSDKYLKNRRKAIGKSMKKEGKMPPQFAKKDDDKEDDSDDKEEKSEDKKKPKKGENPFAKKDDKEDVKEGKYKVKEEDDEDGKKVDCPKCKGKGCDHCDDKGYHMKEDYEYFVENLSDEELDDYIDWLNEEEQLDELSPQLKQRAAQAAQKKADHHMNQSIKHDNASQRIIKRHDTNRRNTGHNAKAANSLDKHSNSSSDQYAKHLKRKRQAQKFSASAAKHEAYDIIDQVLEMRQRARLQDVLSSHELAAIEEKMKQPNDSGTKAEPFMSTNSAGEKKFYADHEKGGDKKLEDMEATSEMDGAKASKAVKSQAPKRRGENRAGDIAMPKVNVHPGQVGKDLKAGI